MKACKNPLLWSANYDRKNNDYTNALRLRCFKWCEFSTNSISYCFICSTLYTCNVFSKVSLYASCYRKISLGPMNNARDLARIPRGINWVRSGPSQLLSEHGDLSYYIYCIFRKKVLGREPSGKVSNQFIVNFNF